MLTETLMARLAAIRTTDPDRAREIAHLAFMEWLGGLPAEAAFPEALRRALVAGQEAERTSAAAAEFCALLREAGRMPPRPLGLRLPAPARRGGARQRRLAQ